MFLRETGCKHDVDDVTFDLFIQIYFTHYFTCFQYLVLCQDRFDIRFDAGDVLTDDQFFFLFLRIVDDHFQHETVYLRFGQRISTFLLDRVLGCHYQEGFRQLIRVFADCHLTFLHGFQQCTLYFGRCTVNFIRQHKISEDRALFYLKLFAFLTINHCTDHVGRQQVRRKLYTAVFSIDQ